MGCQFCDNRYSGNHTFVLGHEWIAVSTVDMCHPISVKIVIKDLRITMLSICVFSKNPHREFCAFVIGVGELHSRLYCEMWHFESRGRLRTVCIISLSVLLSSLTDFSNIRVFIPEPNNLYQNRSENSRFACIFARICIAVIEMIL